MRKRAKAKRFFEHIGILVFVSGIGGLFEVPRGGIEVTFGQGNLAQFEQHHAGQRVIEFAGCQDRSLENGLRLVGLIRGGKSEPSCTSIQASDQ